MRDDKAPSSCRHANAQAQTPVKNSKIGELTAHPGYPRFLNFSAANKLRMNGEAQSCRKAPLPHVCKGKNQALIDWLQGSDIEGQGAGVCGQVSAVKVKGQDSATRLS